MKSERANNSYVDLKVWQKSLDLAESIYHLTKSFPSTENYGLTSQLRRSSVSVASNIAEGCARDSRKEFLKFISIARGSVAEVNTQTIIAKRIGLFKEDDYKAICMLTDEIGRMLAGLKKSVESQLSSHNTQLTTHN